MNNIRIHLQNVFVIGIPLLLFGIIIMLINSSFLSGGTILLNFAITADLILTIPIVYFLLIRKTKIPKTTIVLIMLIGLLIGSFCLPKASQFFLNAFKTWVFPLIELSLLTIVIIKVRHATIKYKQLKGDTPDFFTALKNTCYEILPKRAVMPFVTEIAVIYYGFIRWKKLKPQPNTFTYHKRTGTQALFGAFIFIILIETIAFHLLLSSWSVIVAWILTILSIYTGMQIIGFGKSLSQRPISITDKSLLLHYGILNEAEILLSDIEKIELNRKSLAKHKLTKTLSPLGDLEGHNVVIYLKKENVLTGVYGIKSKFTTIALHVDKQVAFKKSLEEAIENPQAFKIEASKTKVKTRKISTLSEKQKSLRATLWILGVTWSFAFTSFAINNNRQSTGYGITLLTFALLPAIISIGINKYEGGKWKDLQFKKPKLKLCLWAFFTPLLYFSAIFTTQYIFGVRSPINWDKLGSISELIFALIYGFPIMLVLILGEEIAWRGYLQEKFINIFGGVKGLILLGLLWGIWHLPLSLQGHNFPNYPIIETFITTPLMCIALALLIGYIGLNTKSIIIGQIFHASNNHFGGIFMYITDTYSEINHAIIFSVFYLIIIGLFAYLYHRRAKKKLLCNY